MRSSVPRDTGAAWSGSSATWRPAPGGVPFAYRGAPEHPAAPRLYFTGVWGQFSGEIRLGPIHARRITRPAARHGAHHDNEQKRPEGAERYMRVKLPSGH